jgi:hypothetical protein
VGLLSFYTLVFSLVFPVVFAMGIKMSEAHAEA